MLSLKLWTQLMYGKNGFAKVSKKLVRYRSKNNYVKYICIK